MNSEPYPQTGQTFWQRTLLHWIFLVMALGVITLSFLMRTGDGQAVYLPGSNSPLPESCSARIYFGVSCPGCGLTRSFINISDGEFQRAWQLNPASFLVYLFAAIQIPWQLYQIWRIVVRKSEIFSIWLFVPIMICTAGLVVQWIVKLANGIFVVM